MYVCVYIYIYIYIFIVPPKGGRVRGRRAPGAQGPRLLCMSEQHVYVCMHACMYAHIHIYIYIMYIHTHVRICICTCVYIYIYA